MGMCVKVKCDAVGGGWTHPREKPNIEYRTRPPARLWESKSRKNTPPLAKKWFFLAYGLRTWPIWYRVLKPHYIQL